MNTPESVTPFTIGDADFDTALAADDRPLLVDFHADWCPPCRALAPVLERLAATHADRVRVARVDVDASPALVERFGVSSVPTLILLRGDEVLDRLSGGIDAADLRARVERLT